jgi:aminotransferase
MAGAAALALPATYYEKLRADYHKRRDILLGYLHQAGFAFHEPEGAYYVMTDIRGLSDTDDHTFVRRMIQEVGVSAVPGSSFYAPPEDGRTKVRFMFAKKEETLHEAGRRLLRLRRSINPVA